MAGYNFYFSPTGGTKRVAGIFTESWGSEFIEVDLMKKTMPLSVMDICEDDFCVFSVPSYGGRVPAPVRERFELFSGKGAKAVLIAVFGNRAIDDTLLEMYDLLTEAGFSCIAGIEAVSEHSLARKYGKGRPDESDRKDIAEFARTIKKGIEEGTVTSNLPLPGNRPYTEFSGVPVKPVTSGCIKCGICAEECPVNAIPLEMPMRTDKSKCISCMRCVEICPVNARKINKIMAFGVSKMLKSVCSERKPNKLYI